VKKLVLVLLLALAGCPAPHIPTATDCPNKPNCGQCATIPVCVWCTDGQGSCVATPTTCAHSITISDLCE
jgi:hypothetical protein